MKLMKQLDIGVSPPASILYPCTRIYMYMDRQTDRLFQNALPPFD